MQKTKAQSYLVYGVFLLILIMQIGFSLQARTIKARWSNVPPAPSEAGLLSMSLGDRQLGYRVTGIILQNLGNTGGANRSFSEYNYDALGRWFFLADKMDPVSEFAPLLASYYFGATREAKDLTQIIDYLAMVGKHPGDQKWRWLGQAVYLARFKQGDLEKSLRLAEELAALWKPGRPAWVKQMPVFVMTAQGDKESAYNMMTAILQEEGDEMQPAEVYFMVDYICTRILDKSEAAQNPLCKTLKH